MEAPDGKLTYAELEAASNRLARKLRSLGVVRESRVGVAVPRGARELCALLGTLKAGGAYVPVDPGHPVERVRVILEDAAPEVLIAPSDSPLRDAMPPGTRLLALDDLAAATAGLDGAPLDEAFDPEQLAYILFTSGSTGRPKGVEVLRGGFANFLRSMAREPGLREDDRFLAITTTTFDISGLELFGPLWVGATTAIVDRQTSMDPRLLGDLLATGGFTVLQATPATWRMLVDAGWKGTPGLRMFCGGEALSRDLADRLLERGAELWNLYGPTETTVWSTLDRILPDGARITIGRPVDRTRVYVLDPSLSLVPPGVVGEIFIGGDGVARGYRGRPDLTAERFLPDPFGPPGSRFYRTGDLGRLLEDGRFECLGRTNHQVKVRGFRIELGEIEAALRGRPGRSRGGRRRREASRGRPSPRRLLDGRRGAPRALRAGPQRARAVHGSLGLRPARRLPAHHQRQDRPQGPAQPRRRRLRRRPRPRPASARRHRGPHRLHLGRRPRHRRRRRRPGLLRPRRHLPPRHPGSLPHRAGVRPRDSPPRLLRIPHRLLHRQGALGAAVDPDEPIVAWLSRKPAGVPPVFCLLGIQLYQDVAEALGGSQPVVGIHVPVRYRPGDSASIQIEAIAARYVSLIRSIQPSGPYHLAGFCFGGVVAYEVARQLERAGLEVAQVAIFDGGLPGAFRTQRLAQIREAGSYLIRPSRALAWFRRRRRSRAASVRPSASPARGPRRSRRHQP